MRRGESPVVYGTGLHELFSVGSKCYDDLDALRELQGFEVPPRTSSTQYGSRAASPAVFATGLRRLLSLSTKQYSDLEALGELASGLPPLPYIGISQLCSLQRDRHIGLTVLHRAAEPGLELILSLDEMPFEGLSQLKLAFESETPKHPSTRSNSNVRAPTPPSSKTSARASGRPPSRAEGSRGSSGSGLPPVRRRTSELYSPYDKLVVRKLRHDGSTSHGLKRNSDNIIGGLTPPLSSPAASLPPISRTPAHVNHQSKLKLTFMQSVVAKEGKLRGEISSIQNRTCERERERKLRQEKKKSSKNDALPPIYHKDRHNAVCSFHKTTSPNDDQILTQTKQTTGRGKLLYDICKRYKTRIR